MQRVGGAAGGWLAPEVGGEARLDLSKAMGLDEADLPTPPAIDLGAAGSIEMSPVAPRPRFDPPRSDGVVDPHGDALYYDWNRKLRAADNVTMGIGIEIKPAAWW